MANNFYKITRENQENGTLSVDWDTDTIHAYLVRTSGGGGTPYTPDFDLHDFLADVDNGGYARASGPIVVASRSVDSPAGLVRLIGGPITFTSVAAGDACQGILFVKNVTTDADSPLLFLHDTGTGLPVTPNGGDITFTFPSNVIVEFAIP